ncbi:hypothetical protein NLI96_g4355 [Meripilus lineatus]|uniref:3-oxoacyl-[acyl-carrier-protein] reductase n=1 Tax=Meripilus lineatus TaxID=2056292 RepID=A0AAD5YEV8_9APHY|nr:hypothetical protein NLI96_g4355 [Physisporinus lineatus]
MSRFSEPKLKGKLALITGCTGGIGRSSAKALIRLGCSLAIHHFSEASLQKAEDLRSYLLDISPNAEVEIFQADLRTYPAVDELHRQVVNKMGRDVDVLFVNHGATGRIIGPNGDIGGIPPEMFEEIWRLHTGSTFRLTQLCIPHMEKQKWGRVIFTSSVAATTGGVIGPHYASSKSALHGLVHWLSLRYAKTGIVSPILCTFCWDDVDLGTDHGRVLDALLTSKTSNAVAPALIEDTGMIPESTEELRSKIPIGRLGQPDEIAEIVALLATNAYMTNKIIAADGGWT